MVTHGPYAPIVSPMMAALSAEFFDVLLPNVESLCAAVDPVATPYASKYDARTRLESFISTAEATAESVEGAERAVLCDALAVAHAQSGAAAVATDETGAGEAHLTTALPWLASRFGVPRAESTWRPTVAMSSAALGVPPALLPLTASTASDGDDGASMPLRQRARLATAALTTASQLALVYSGWDNHARALKILRVAKRVHRVARSVISASTSAERLDAAECIIALDDAYTHLIFYFAQVYGHLGCPAIAARYVERTLMRQLASDERGRAHSGASLDRLEWARNALRLSEAHAVGARPNVVAAALCLAAADLMLGHLVAEAGSASSGNGSNPTVRPATDCEAAGEAADLLREPTPVLEPRPLEESDGPDGAAAQRTRTVAESALHWALLFESILREAAERHTLRDSDPSDVSDTVAAAPSVGTAAGAPAPSNDTSDPFSTVTPIVFSTHAGEGSTRGEGADAVDVNDSDHCADVDGDAGAPSPLVFFLCKGQSADVSAAVRSFAPARVGPAPHPGKALLSGLSQMPSAGTIRNFSQAREVFLAAVAAFERAAEYFVLNGFVTEFRVITEGHARAYRSLAVFELDETRRAAMHKRRAKLLEKLAFELSPAAYAAAVKELSFAAGCAWMDACESSVTLEPSEKLRKDINLTVDNAVAAFSLFSRGFNVPELNFKGAPLPPFAGASTTVDSDMAEPFALAHFYCARMLFRRTATSKADRVRDAHMSLERFQHFLQVCKIVGAHDSTFLQPQVRLALEVVVLLPQKIRLLLSETANF